MNAILFTLYYYNKCTPQLIGSLFDSIEYYLITRQYNKDIKLLFNPLFIGNVPSRDSSTDLISAIKEMIHVRYDVDENHLDNIELINLNKLILTQKFDKLLLVDYTTPTFLKDKFIRAKEVHILTELTSKDFFYTSKYNKVVYHTEMPFCYSDVEYKMKFAFDIYKPINNFTENIYVNYPKKDYTREDDLVELVNSFNKPQLQKKYGENYYNLHELFDEYVYIKSNAWFDTRPRLFHECKFYGKPYYYYNFLNIKDGSYYRYESSKDECYLERNLTKDDNIIKIMSN